MMPQVQLTAVFLRPNPNRSTIWDSSDLAVAGCKVQKFSGECVELFECFDCLLVNISHAIYCFWLKVG